MSRTFDTVGRDLIRNYLRSCEYVVDLGCGPEKIRPDARGMDCDPGMDPDELVDISRLVWLTGYDGVCMSHSLEHIADTRRILKLIYDGLPSGGRIAVIVPNGEAVCAETLGDGDCTHEMLFTPTTLGLYLSHVGFAAWTRYYQRPDAYNETRGIFGCGVKP